MSPRRFRIPCFLLLLLIAMGFSSTVAVGAQAVAFGRKLFVLHTEYFDIVFPREIEADAVRLASFADSEKAALEALYGVDGGGSIPVLLTDEYPDLNGYSTSLPSDRIVLYIAPAGLTGELAGLNDTLRSVFVHELTHSLDFRRRSPLWNLVSRIAGDAVPPVMWVLPTFMIEGAAVYSESRGGWGRNGDPAVRSIILQAKAEDSFPPYFSVSGARDTWNSGSLPYIFGGSFVQYLVSTYGEAKLAALGSIAAQGDVFSGFGGTVFGAGAFRNVFGGSLAEAWKGFENSLSLTSQQVRETERVYGKPLRIAALAASGSTVYMADSEAGSIFAVGADSLGPPGPGFGSVSILPARRIFPADGAVDRMDLSPDGAELLVSWRIQDADGRSIPTVFRLDAKTGIESGTRLAGMRAASWSGNGPVAIGDDGFSTSLILPGRASVVHPYDELDLPLIGANGNVYALAKREGRSHICKIDTASGTSGILDAGEAQFRSLAKGPGGIILASFAEEGRFPRLAILDDSGSRPSLSVQSIDVSGGVHMPVMTASGEVFHAGRFVSGEFLCRLPADLVGGMTEKACEWRAVNSPSSLGTEMIGPVQESTGVAPESTGVAPHLFRTFRYPVFGTYSAGLRIQGMDIAERLSWQAELLYDWRYSGLSASLVLEADSRPLSFAFGLSDAFGEGGSIAGSGVRRSKAWLSAVLSRSLVPARRRFAAGAWAELSALADDVMPGAAYSSSWDLGSVSAGLKAGLSEWLVSRYPPRGNAGHSFSAGADMEVALESTAGTAFSLFSEARFAVKTAGLECSLHAAYSPDRMVAFGPVSRRLSFGSGTRPSAVAINYPRFEEYAGLPATSPWYAFAEVSIRAFSAELQSGIPIPGFGTPFYIRRIVGRAGVRAAGFDEGSAAPDPATPLVLPASLFMRVEAQLVSTHAASNSGSTKPGIELSWATDRRLAPSAFRLGLSFTVTP